MKYSSGAIGRVFIIRLEDGDALPGSGTKQRGA